ncbi:MAG: archaeoflavoprotein AfpA [Candidatus Thorarchaeota archaeon]|nr:MAG: archaeoflavoprotein AfpA [Candidatus Thorarchaeota archaeon]
MYFYICIIGVLITVIRIIWGITGSGDRIDEILETMIHLKEMDGLKISVVVSKAGEQVLRWYNLLERLRASFDRVQIETNANVPFIAGPLQIGKYDLLIVAPLTGNSTAKIVYGIADTLITNAVAQALKGHTPVYVYPVDQFEEPIETESPDGIKFTVHPRTIDLENVNRLRNMESVTVLTKPSEIVDIVRRNVHEES